MQMLEARLQPSAVPIAVAFTNEKDSSSDEQTSVADVKDAKRVCNVPSRDLSLAGLGLLTLPKALVLSELEEADMSTYMSFEPAGDEKSTTKATEKECAAKTEACDTAVNQATVESVQRALRELHELDLSDNPRLQLNKMFMPRCTANATVGDQHETGSLAQEQMMGEPSPQRDSSHREIMHPSADLDDENDGEGNEEADWEPMSDAENGNEEADWEPLSGTDDDAANVLVQHLGDRGTQLAQLARDVETQKLDATEATGQISHSDPCQDRSNISNAHRAERPLHMARTAR